MANNSLTVFNFESSEIRFIEGCPVANDIAQALGYVNPSKTVSTKVSEKYKGLTELVTPGGVQSVTILKEPGMYQLILSSKLPSAERFREWLFEEVLPSIRKTGSYSANPEPQQQKRIASEVELDLKIIEQVKDTSVNFAQVQPRLAQELTDHLMNLLKGQNALPSDEPRLRGVVEIAMDMGYKASDSGVRTKLGKFVKGLVGHLSQQEKRLCNGVPRPIYCYPDIPEVRSAIARYFS